MKKLLGLAAAFTLVLSSSALYAMDDASIAKNVQAKITSGTNVPAAGAPNVVVHAKDGKVMIYGIVDTKTQKEDMEKMVKNMEGVKKVDMEVKVIND